MALPAEIRMKIFHHAIVKDTVLRPQDCWERKVHGPPFTTEYHLCEDLRRPMKSWARRIFRDDSGTKRLTNLLAVSRQVRDETAEVFGQNVIRSHVHQFCSGMGELATGFDRLIASHLKQFMIDIPFLFQDDSVESNKFHHLMLRNLSGLRRLTVTTRYSLFLSDFHSTEGYETLKDFQTTLLREAANILALRTHLKKGVWRHWSGGNIDPTRWKGVEFEFWIDILPQDCELAGVGCSVLKDFRGNDFFSTVRVSPALCQYATR